MEYIFSLSKKNLVEKYSCARSISNNLLFKKKFQLNIYEFFTRIFLIIKKILFYKKYKISSYHFWALDIAKKINPDYIIAAGGIYENFELFKDINCQQFVCIAGSESNKFNQLEINPNFNGIKLIMAPYPREMGTFLPKHFEEKTFELSTYTFTGEYHDSLFAIALQLTLEIDVSEVNLIGFDGYGLNSNNNMLEVSRENQYLIDHFTSFSNIPINSFTPTEYKNITTKSIFCNL